MPKCPFRYPLRKRSDIIDFICDDSRQYSRVRCDTYPLTWNVKAWAADFSVNYAMSLAVSEFLTDRAKGDRQAVAAYRCIVEQEFSENEKYLFDWGLEGARFGVTDADTYSMIWDGTNVGAVFTFTGRSGGYMALEEWNGWTLRGQYSCDLREAMEDEDSCWTYPELRLLYKYVVEMDHMLTPEKAAAEVQYQGTWQLLANIVEPAWESSEAHKRLYERKVTVDSPRRVIVQR